MMKKIFLGLGSDTGDRMNYISGARKMISAEVGKIKRVSSVYETEPWGFLSDGSFLNMAIETETELNPSELLGRILMIESGLGRKRNKRGYESRIIDIDILFFDDVIINAGSLIIPHPHLHERKFVLVPLSEIASGFVHPVLRKSVRELLEECEDKGEVRLYEKR